MSRAKYYLWSSVAQRILQAMDEGETQVTISPDLNRTTAVFPLQATAILFDADNAVSRQQLLEITKKAQRIFILEGNELRIAERRDGHYYKLVPTDGAPTVEIDGVKMHRSKVIDPFDDAQQKVREVVRAGQRVLDTCGGLGYTAIWALRLGARHVVSVERDDNIQQLRRENPWSRELYDPRIQLVSADVFHYIETLESDAFDSILHDPPRFSFAGELYSEEFYRQLLRVLVKGGGLFHYTGTPHIVRRGNTFLTNTVQRLKAAGFRTVLPREQILGVKAIK